MLAMNDLRLIFECGCRFYAWSDATGMTAGLSCCHKHESANQQLENILPLTLKEFRTNHSEATSNKDNKQLDVVLAA